ncbi:MAG TPA: hypothetical protein VNE19_06870 [Methylomirabilota bacterium]|nr:hypothetical protein [Methylomirabilota bacterium]
MAIEDRLEELFMNDANNRRVASVNVPQRPSRWRGVAAFAGAAAIVGIALVAVILGLREGQQAASPTATATATAIPSATSTATTTPSATQPSVPSGAPASMTYQSPLGYSVQLPAGYRRSDLQSRTTPNPQGDPELLGYEVFTTRTPADEAETVRRLDTGPFTYSASVSLYRNSRNESAMAFADRQKGGFGLVVVSTEPTTVDGRTAAKVTFKFFQADAKTFYSLYVADGDRIWVVSYVLGQPADPVPAGATEEGLRSIVESFKFAR